LLAALAVGLLYAPFLRRGPLPIGSVSTFVQRFRFNDPIFAGLERLAAPQAVAVLAVLSGLVTAVWVRSKRPVYSPDALAWPIAASLACAPVVYPWYLLWVVPFLQSASMLPITVWTLSILAVFFTWYSNALGGPWQVTGWVLWLEYGSVAMAAAIALLCRRLESSKLVAEKSC
jgi:alpha-1,6-mannosyltransferase